ncbi:MAG: S-layer homology domain-containing protein [Ignavibacteriales bacterium]
MRSTFDDLSGVEWARRPVEVLASKGIINGAGANTYSPAASITRADYLSLLVKTLGLTAQFYDNFDDVEKSAYYHEAIGIAKRLGIASGTGENRFNPGEASPGRT